MSAGAAGAWHMVELASMAGRPSLSRSSPADLREATSSYRKEKEEMTSGPYVSLR